MGARFTIEAYILDDGSTDGTADAVRARFDAGVHLARGSECYWARGMATAQRMAARHDPDFQLWINDDVRVMDEAVEALLEVSSMTDPPAIAVGAMTDPMDGHVTYSGTRLRNRRPGSLSLVEPTGVATPIDSFHGNLVLVPRWVYHAVGTVDPAFAHAYGDNDYGLRARRAGVPILLAPRSLGQCVGNELDQIWMTGGGNRRYRTRQLFGRKGLPLRSHLRYNVRHGGAIGVGYAAASYARALRAIWLRRSRVVRKPK